jgi:hypothetical protein
VEEQTGMQQQILDERFPDMASRYGTGRARRWYWSQSVKTIASLAVRGFRTAPWLIVTTTVTGALLLQFVTGNLQRVIMEFISLLNHHVTPYYDSKHAASQMFWMYYTVFVGSLLLALIIGSFVAMVAKRREMIATISLGSVSLVMTATTFWTLVARHEAVDPVLFPKIMIDQLGASFLIVIGGIIVREIRSAAPQSLKHPAFIYGLAFAVSVVTLVVAYFPFYWLLVQIQTWRLGHPNPFTIGPAMDAIPCSSVAAVIAFWFTLRAVLYPQNTGRTTAH